MGIASSSTKRLLLSVAVASFGPFACDTRAHSRLFFWQKLHRIDFFPRSRSFHAVFCSLLFLILPVVSFDSAHYWNCFWAAAHRRVAISIRIALDTYLYSSRALVKISRPIVTFCLQSRSKKKKKVNRGASASGPTDPEIIIFTDVASGESRRHADIDHRGAQKAVPRIRHFSRSRKKQEAKRKERARR